VQRHSYIPPATPAPPASRFVYDFADGSREMRELLGGKGAGLAEMARVLAPGTVPAGFTITTEACVSYLRDGIESEGLAAEVDAGIARLEATVGRRLGDGADPLLVSVRSGARVSMPGMMDTVLNLGLNEASVEGLAARTGNPRFAWDCFRRLHQMFGTVVRGVPGSEFEALIARARSARRSDPSRVRLLEHPTGDRVPAPGADSGRLGNSRDGAADGVREHRTALGVGSGVLARRDHRCADSLR
jgi:phosphoenolpyruvate synthase/pyruvate phosphate dikinase